MQTDQETRASGSWRLTIFTEEERLALYGLPDFDDFQRAEFLAFTEAERAVADKRKGQVERLHCLLQLGYFKAKHAFFDLARDAVPAEDIAFLADRYFPDLPAASFGLQILRRRERDAQRAEIARLFGFRLWSEADRAALVEAATELARRDVTPSFIGLELLGALKDRKIVRPGYTTLQSVISAALTVERKRLDLLVEAALDAQTVKALRDLLVREGTLTELAALAELKKDARNFGHKMMTAERLKRATLAPLYQAAKSLLPTFGVSQQNITRYADLALFYTIYDLRRMRAAQAHLYLLCYAWQRFRQLSDNLVDAFDHHLLKIEDETKANSLEAFVQAQAKRQQEAPKVGRVLLLYVDAGVDDATPFAMVRKQAFAILPREALLSAGQRLCEEPVSQMELRWNEIDRAAPRIKKNLRPLVMALDVSAVSPANPWCAALSWMRAVFAREQPLSQRPITEIPAGTIPKQLHRHLYVLNEAGTPVRLRGDRYEFWTYRQLSRRLAIGELAVDDSLRHRRFGDELVSPEKTAAILQTLTIPWVTNPAGTRNRRALHCARPAVGGLRPGSPQRAAHAYRLRPGAQKPHLAPAKGRAGGRDPGWLLRQAADPAHRRCLPLRRPGLRLPVDPDAAPAPLCQEACRRGRADGRDHGPGHGLRHLRYVPGLRHPLSRTRGDRPTAHPAGHAARQLRPDQRLHRRAVHLPALRHRPGDPLRRRRRPEVRRGHADHQGPVFPQVLRVTRGCV